MKFIFRLTVSFESLMWHLIRPLSLKFQLESLLVLEPIGRICFVSGVVEVVSNDP